MDHHPPQRIQIKRKRGQPAPDSLYLQPEAEADIRSTPKRTRTENAFIFRRLVLDATPIAAPPTQADHTSPTPNLAPQNETNATIVQAPRRFRLTRSLIKSHIPTHLPPSSRKRRRNNDELATFIELAPVRAAHVAAIEAASNHNDAPERPTTPPLKRPTTRVARISPPTSRSSTPPTIPSEDTITALQSMANEVAAAEAQAVRSTPKLKYNPIVPQRRNKDRNLAVPTPIPIPTLANPTPHHDFGKIPAKDPDAMDIDDADYIVETYIRHVVPSSEPLPLDIGLLIIPASEEELWESYLDNEISSDEEPLSDEEDSNAEDWHGADYPEGELSDDDEMDDGAWKYYGKKKRRGSESGSEGSEDDEYGYQGSDDEDEEGDWRREFI